MYTIIVGEGAPNWDIRKNPPNSGNAYPDGGVGYGLDCGDACSSSTCQCFNSGGGGGRSAIQFNGNELVTGINSFISIAY